MRSAFLFLLALSFASGQKPATTSAMSPDVRKEILAFELNMPRADHLISALPLMSRFFMSQSPEILATWGKLSVAKKIANLEKSPQAMANLKPYGLTAKEYIVGVPALVRWVCGPSLRTAWPIFIRESHVIIRGPTMNEMNSAVMHASTARNVR